MTNNVSKLPVDSQWIVGFATDQEGSIKEAFVNASGYTYDDLNNFYLCDRDGEPVFMIHYALMMYCYKVSAVTTSTALEDEGDSYGE